MTRPSIPLREKEVIEAEIERKGDSEKVATTSLKQVEWRSVILSSRYNKAHEYETMLDILTAIPDNLTSLIYSIFCDSKAPAVYSVRLQPCSLSQARSIGDKLNSACIRSDNWHNGIFVFGSQGGELYYYAGLDEDTVVG